MAYFDQEKKKAIEPDMKKLLKSYGVKGTLSVANNMKIVLKLKSGKIDFNSDAYADQLQIMANGKRRDLHTGEEIQYQIDRTFKENTPAHDFLKKAYNILHRGNWHRCDIQSDDFRVGHFVSIKIGAYNKAYAVTN